MTKAETTSDSPVELAPGGFKIRIRWKFILSIFGLLLGGGGLASVAAMFNAGTSVAGDFDSFKSEQSFQHTLIDNTFKDQDARTKLQDGRIETISKAITSVQTTQQRDVARTEARRLSEKISNRKDREDTYDRLLEFNLRRLGRGEDPCANVNCD
jgi:hypothetical protein